MVGRTGSPGAGEEGERERGREESDEPVVCAESCSGPVPGFWAGRTDLRTPFSPSSCSRCRRPCGCSCGPSLGSDLATRSAIWLVQHVVVVGVLGTGDLDPGGCEWVSRWLAVCGRTASAARQAGEADLDPRRAWRAPRGLLDPRGSPTVIAGRPARRRGAAAASSRAISSCGRTAWSCSRRPRPPARAPSAFSPPNGGEHEDGASAPPCAVAHDVHVSCPVARGRRSRRPGRTRRR